MADPHRLNRRHLIAGASALALTPALAPAQTAPSGFAAFAARCRDLSGFDALPTALVQTLKSQLNDQQVTAITERSSAARSLNQTVLKALYTGLYEGAATDDSGNRIAYSDALMFAAVEESVNVPSFCGGVPGYWAEKPKLS